MKNEFASYTQALALKELGFDEPCFGYFNNTTIKGWLFDFGPTLDVQTLIFAPTYQQAFRWFREKHKLYSPITDNGLGQYDFRVKHEWCGRVYDTYEEAESACLDKLIEIVKKT